MEMKKKVIILILFIMAFSFILPKNSMAILLAETTIYKEPSIKTNGDQGKGLDDMIEDAEAFEKKKGEEDVKFSQDKLQVFSSDLYSVLFVTATVVSVLVGIVIGFRYMVGSVEEKAEYKKLLVPYLAGCVAVYGALGIWKLLVTMLGSI